MKELLIGALFTAGVASGLQADDWPQFRGPGGRGITAERDLPLKWDQENGIRWTVDLPGRGLSSPVIVGDRLYLTACTGWEQKRLHVFCFDPTTGQKRWERQFWATGGTQCNGATNMAAPTPAANANGVFALFATCDLVALDKDGNLQWYRALTKDYPTIGNNVGIAASPVLHQNVLFVPMENVGESFAAGIDARTGQNLWKQDRDSKINWTTPFVATNAGHTEVIFQSGGKLTAYDPISGSTLWEYKAKFSTIPSLVAAEGMVFAPGGPSVALQPGAEGPKKLWDSSRVGSATASPTLYKGRLYTINKEGIVTCTDAKTGEVVTKVRTKGPYSASPVISGERMYLINEKGLTTVLKLGNTMEILATNKLGDNIQGSPAVSGGALYIRSDKRLYCIGGVK